MVGMTGLFAAAHPQGAVSLRSTLRRLFFSAFSRPPAPPSEPISPWVLIPPYPTIKKPPNGGLFIIGRNDGIRTHGPYVPNVVLYQAELHSDAMKAFYTFLSPLSSIILNNYQSWLLN